MTIVKLSELGVFLYFASPTLHQIPNSLFDNCYNLTIVKLTELGVFLYFTSPTLHQIPNSLFNNCYNLTIVKLSELGVFLYFASPTLHVKMKELAAIRDAHWQLTLDYYCLTYTPTDDGKKRKELEPSGLIDKTKKIQLTKSCGKGLEKPKVLINRSKNWSGARGKRSLAEPQHQGCSRTLVPDTPSPAHQGLISHQPMLTHPFWQ